MPAPRFAVLFLLVLHALAGGPASGETPANRDAARFAAAALDSAAGEPEPGLGDRAAAPDGGCRMVPRFWEDATLRGRISDEAEEDSAGFLLGGRDGCPGAPIR